MQGTEPQMYTKKTIKKDKEKKVNFNGQSGHPFEKSQFTDGTICPICGQPNECAIANGKPFTTCWCLSKQIPLALLKKAGTADVCICESCVDAYHEE
jgi:hypothetical protein